MKELVLISGGVLGVLSVILGAFGAHALKKRFNEDQLKSFETGVKYQMYHSILLVICGLNFPFLTTTQHLMGWCFLIGIVMFSFSIYLLTWSSANGKKIKIVGPVTPLGGLLLLAGWIFLTINLAQLTSVLNS